MPTISGLDVKREIAQFKLRGDEREALIAGFVRSCMSLSITNRDGLTLGLDCQSDFVREYISAAMLQQFKVRPKSDETEFVYSDCEKLLRLLGIFDPDSDSFEIMSVPERYYEVDHAFVRGMFLGCGSFSVHEADADENTGKKTGGGYHLEFSVLSESLADELTRLLERRGITVHKMIRADKCVVYAKDSENVCNCLALMRLDNLVLKLTDTVITLSFKKDVNRRLNCELANMTRTANAAVDVSEAIEYIDKLSGLDTLNPKLLEAADARRNSPDKTLAELAYELGISKSGLKHRYDKIIEIAASLKNKTKN